MILHLHREIENLKKRIVLLAGTVERQVEDAVRAIERREPQLAEKVREKDAEIDLAEIDVEEECLKILALHQPVAIDLRFIVAVMKINNDLERIGNQAVVMAEQVLALVRLPGAGSAQTGLADMLERAEVMVRESVEALLRRDVGLAWRIWEEHAGAEEDLRRVMASLAAALEKRPVEASRAVHLARAAMALGRVGENTKDIAEEVIYMREGIVVKHHEREFLRRRKRASAGSGG